MFVSVKAADEPVITGTQYVTGSGRTGFLPTCCIQLQLYSNKMVILKNKFTSKHEISTTTLFISFAEHAHDILFGFFFKFSPWVSSQHSSSCCANIKTNKLNENENETKTVCHRRLK